MKNKKAAFFDRDGTLIQDVSYLSDIKHIALVIGIVDFCLQLQRDGYKLFVVTNQSGIARGYFDEQFVQETHRRLHDIFLKQNIIFSGWYYCPHHPNDQCACRKPKPGMLFNAAQTHHVDLSQSLMFGDRKLDIEAGNAAGCKSFYIADALRNGI